ncbi:dextransucrase [Limosilactobacillus equigenerosi DSM 18793 = JCM 14505]|uniref:Dextransucrase n=1 Tax=Limosilactobacillus equigenerosi DSM 18793 = JCM 14505 TaxID=1423742 RepID=A0A0R1UW98_9LACO|nr:dextransucrase [Limosilactobacillus equigenerosi DSM 18793 = JCM 14505]
MVFGGMLVNVPLVQADDSTSTSNLNQATKANNQLVMSTSPVSSMIKNGWQQNSDQSWTYYTNGQVKTGKDYVKLPTINGTGENWYLVDNGQAQNQIQSWAGSFWYFDPNTYLLSQKRQLVSEWGNQYVVGEDGRIQSGVQQVNGQIYDMDSNTYTFSKRRAYDKANNGNWYLVDHGHAQSGVQAWSGSYWYFNSNNYLLSTKRDYVKSQWGLWYLVGNDGRIQSGVQEWAGSYWYFDPNTYLLRTKKDYIKSQWGSWYLVGNDGRIQSGVQEWAGSYWFFDPNTYLLVKNQQVWFNGKSYYATPSGQLLTSQLKTINGRLYAFNGQGVMSDLSPIINKVNALGSNIQVAIQSQKTGEIFSYNNSGNMRYHTASTIKVTVLAMLLHNTGGKLDGTQYDLAQRMIRNSDNDATTTIINRYLGGNRNLNQAFRDLGMNESYIDQHWGTTETSATDQLKLLHEIYLNPNDGYLNQSSKNTIKSLMGSVTPSQRWGISAGSSNYYIKNGWNSSNGAWWVSSIGFIPQGWDNGYTIAVYTFGNNYPTGANKIEQVAQTVKNLLG